MYPEELVAPMRADLTSAGFEEMKSSQKVEEVLSSTNGTTLVVVNSVCGCAAGNARPGAKMSVENEKKPTRLTTVFAGVDTEATQMARQFMLPFPASSPSIALFKEGKLVHFVERHHIEGSSAEMVAENLKAAFNEHC
jgi:putative YphP/YqiW family bacilliredoxin